MFSESQTESEALAEEAINIEEGTELGKSTQISIVFNIIKNFW